MKRLVIPFALLTLLLVAGCADLAGFFGRKGVWTTYDTISYYRLPPKVHSFRQGDPFYICVVYYNDQPVTLDVLDLRTGKVVARRSKRISSYGDVQAWPFSDFHPGSYKVRLSVGGKVQSTWNFNIIPPAPRTRTHRVLVPRGAFAGSGPDLCSPKPKQERKANYAKFD